MPEYGYSSGGIVNTVTKSGGNEFHGSIWGNLTPGLFTPPSEAVGRERRGGRLLRLALQGLLRRRLRPRGGRPHREGPALVLRRLRAAARLRRAHRVLPVPDRLHRQHRPTARRGSPARPVRPCSSCSPSRARRPVYGTGSTATSRSAKLTWLVEREPQPLRVASTPSRPRATAACGSNGNASAATYDRSTTNTTNVVLELHRQVPRQAPPRRGQPAAGTTPRQASVGGERRRPGARPADQAGTRCSRSSWRTSTHDLPNFEPTGHDGLVAGGCYVQNYATGGSRLLRAAPTTNRYAGTASATGLFDLAGQHLLKGGVQIDYATYNGTTAYYSGGAPFAPAAATSTSTAASTGSNSVQLYRAYGKLDPERHARADRSPVDANWCASIDADGNCVNPGGKDPTQPRRLVRRRPTPGRTATTSRTAGPSPTSSP